MKCPLCDHPVDYRSVTRFIAHVHKKHEVKESIALQIWCNILKVCPHCDAIIPESCIGCPVCGKMIKYVENI